MKVENAKWKVNGIELNVAQTGAQDGVPILLLHGFPDYSMAMLEAFKGLAEHGARLIAPDQRGYNLSDKPKFIRDYSLEVLTRDIEELISVMNLKQVVLIGHDWGAMVAWYLTNRRPDLIHKLVIINAPHYEVFKRHLLFNPVQILKSFYIFLLLLPKLPETLLAWDNFSIFKFMLKRGGHPKVESVENVWKKPGALTGMINWYRAIFYSIRLPHRKIETPTLILWGEDDPFLSLDMAHESQKHCHEAKLEIIRTCGHWPHLQKEEETLGLLKSFIR